MAKSYSFTRDPLAPHITTVVFEGKREMAKIFSPERGLLGRREYIVRFYDGIGDARADRHVFDRYATARKFVVDCFVNGAV